MQPTEEFPTSDLIACANRELGFRKSCYPKWAKVTRIEELPAGKQREIEMMAAIPERLRVLNDSALALQAFKDFVHTTLDNAGIDKHEEQNATTGCRVGARLADLIKAAATPAPLADAELAAVLTRLATAQEASATWLANKTDQNLFASMEADEQAGKDAASWLPGLLARLAAAEAAPALPLLQETPAAAFAWIPGIPTLDAETSREFTIRFANGQERKLWWLQGVTLDCLGDKTYDNTGWHTRHEKLGYKQWFEKWTGSAPDAYQVAAALPLQYKQERPGPFSQPVYAPGGVEVSVEEMLKKIEDALIMSYKKQGDEAYNHLYNSVGYAVQVLHKQLLPAGLALAAAPTQTVKGGQPHA